MFRSVSGSSAAAAARSGIQLKDVFVALAVTMMLLVVAFGVALALRPTVTDASRASRLDIVVTSNGTGTIDAHALSVSAAYNLSRTVLHRNDNWAVPVEVPAPLVVARGAAASSPAGVPLGAAGAAAELAMERAEWVFKVEVELRTDGAVKYRPVHAGRNSRLKATCPLKMLMPNAPLPQIMVVLHKGVLSCY